MIDVTREPDCHADAQAIHIHPHHRLAVSHAQAEDILQAGITQNATCFCTANTCSVPASCR